MRRTFRISWDEEHREWTLTDDVEEVMVDDPFYESPTDRQCKTYNVNDRRDRIAP